VRAPEDQQAGEGSWLGRAPDSRRAIDVSCSDVLLPWYASAVFWLLAGSVLGMLASIKLHTTWFLADAEWLTFGRVRPAHLSTMIYGWASMSGVATLLWLTVRLSRCVLPFRLLIGATAMYWNAWVAIGVIAILSGYSTSVEWLEFPWWAAVPLGLPLLLLFVVTLYVFNDRRVEHIYVSQWYLFGATIWFPFLYVAATLLIQLPGATGVMKATANWWFAHNVLGLWLTPIGLASAYYLIPKVLGRPIHSYYLSILGFWTLAIFYNWAGTHHLIGGPLPAWLVTVGIVGSMMMFIPVATVAVNHHFTVVGNFRVLATSPTLRFTVFGAMCYTLVSVQGSLTSLRIVNITTHFTHYTIAHAHLGVYAFYTMVSFGAMYYILPRLVDREWISSRLISIHFWCAAIGITIYWVGLTFGGVLQGLLLNDPDQSFLDIVGTTVPYLWSRSFAGILLTVGHIAFAISVWHMLRRDGEWLVGPTLFSSGRTLFSRMQPDGSRQAQVELPGAAQREGGDLP
jgi:cytochrome c oxidase cbb3-type subunit 1